MLMRKASFKPIGGNGMSKETYAAPMLMKKESLKDLTAMGAYGWSSKGKGKASSKGKPF
jgi:hypothetical protein